MPATIECPLTDDHLAQWDEVGYFVVRSVISPETACEIRGVIRNHIMTPDLEARSDEVDPMDPMGDSPDARAARLRKLGNFCVQSPLIWHSVYGNQAVIDYARHFLGDELLVKYNSCFLKPARTGSITPWHQDNGLWRDGQTEPFNFWMAIDPATRDNGCLQFIPRSHRGEIVRHVVYPDSVHAELPRDVVADQIERFGVEHIELQPGDMVCWHSNLYHFSPKNLSDQSRIAIAGVYSNPEIAQVPGRFSVLHRVAKGGRALDAFPPEQATFGSQEANTPPPPHPEMELTDATPTLAGY